MSSEAVGDSGGLVLFTANVTTWHQFVRKLYVQLWVLLVNLYSIFEQSNVWRCSICHSNADLNPFICIDRVGRSGNCSLYEIFRNGILCSCVFSQCWSSENGFDLLYIKPKVKQTLFAWSYVAFRVLFSQNSLYTCDYIGMNPSCDGKGMAK